MLIKRPSDIKPSEITPEANFLNRRGFIRAASLAGGGLMLGTACSDADDTAPPPAVAPTGDEELVPNSLDDIISYNNFLRVRSRQEAIRPATRKTSSRSRGASPSTARPT